MRTTLAWCEEALYLTVGLLLLAAAVLVIVGTVSGLIDSIRTHESSVHIGVVLLDRILLALIVAELLHTLRFVVLRGEIVVEPFLFVGLIAVVRRILIITAELEGQAPAGVVQSGRRIGGGRDLGGSRGVVAPLAASSHQVDRDRQRESEDAEQCELQ